MGEKTNLGEGGKEGLSDLILGFWVREKKIWRKMAVNYETFDSIVANPQRFFAGENRVICISSRPVTAGPVQQCPQVVFGGKSAAIKLKAGLTEAFRKNPQYVDGFGPSLVEQAKLAKKFQDLTGVKLDLFSSLPLTAFPSTHPFRSNGAWELLEKYQQAKLVPITDFKHTDGVFEVNPTLNKETFVYFLGAFKDKRQFDSEDLHIFHSSRYDVSSFLPDMGNNLFMMYDQEDNLWVSANTLIKLLKGSA